MPQTLPSISSILLPRESPFSQGSLPVDATRELTRCANGELVSHDVVRDGIDALLQLKRASYDIIPPVQHPAISQGTGEREVLRTPPEPPCFPPTNRRNWTDRGVKDANSDDDEASDSGSDDDDFCREPTPDHQRIRPRGANRLAQPSTGLSARNKPIKPPPSPRPPTIWHHRKSDPVITPAAFPTPESPKSKTSADSFSEVEDEATGPAVLHFSCLQCHRAKKRCNRTRPCTRCISRGMENECKYPDKHDPRSVLRACLRCWQTKKKCDRKQPSCGKCDKVGVKCVYRRENQENPEVHILICWKGELIL